MEWLWCLAWIALGVLVTLTLQAALLYRYLSETPVYDEGAHSSHSSQPIMPQDNGDDCAAALTLAMQFLFQELKHAPAPMAWLHRKLTQEMRDLLTKTASGRLFESLTVRTVIAGNTAPRIQWAGVQSLETYPEGRIKTVDLLLDVQYSGGFRIAVDAAMLLGKTACFDVEVEQLSGRARVRFTTEPFTHWSLSFLSTPQLDLCTRSLRGRFASLLQSHARRTLQKRHTLPNYTIRFKPFFTKIDPAQLEPPEDYTFKPQGCLEITLYEITRLYTNNLATSKNNCSIYCSVSLDSSTWISYRQDKEYSIFTLDLVIYKDRSQQLGAVFKQTSVSAGGKTIIVIDTVIPLSAAYKADLRRDDIILAVDNKLISTINQIAKVVKNISKPCFSIRIERKNRRNIYNENSFEDQKSKSTPLDDVSTLKPEKSNSFSFRKMSEVLDTARNVGQEGRAMLRNAHSNWNLHDIENKADLDNLDQKSVVNKIQTQPDDTAPNKSNNCSSVKQSDSVQSTFAYGLRKRRCSVENKTSSDSSNSSTPTASNPGTPSKRYDKGSTKDQIASNKNKSMDDNTNNKYNQDSSTPKIYVEQNLNSSNNDFEFSKKYPGEMEESTLFQFQKFSPIPLSEIMVCDDTIVFHLNKNHRFLNVNVWGKNDDDSEDILLAYLNIPLSIILQECSKSKAGQSVKKFTLLPPEIDLSVSKTHPLSNHSGFEPCLCYGDVLFSFAWRNSEMNEASSNSIDLDKNMREADIDFPDESESNSRIEGENISKTSIQDETAWKTHDFLRTHFHRSTQCDYCGKKIWLKDALQCKDCAMCCHKKCITKCLSSERCQPLLSNNLDGYTNVLQDGSSNIMGQMPEFLMTDHDNASPSIGKQTLHKNTVAKDDPTQKQNESLLGRNTLTGLLGGLRRVGSANSLSPSVHSPSSVRSLPPSPQHILRPQTPDDNSAWLTLDASIEKGMTDINDLVQILTIAQLPFDMLMAKARDYGPQLLTNLSSNERSEKISVLVSNVKASLDEENKRLQLADTKTAFTDCGSQSHLYRNDEERSQILTALLLHFCSALQSVNKDVC